MPFWEDRENNKEQNVTIGEENIKAPNTQEIWHCSVTVNSRTNSHTNQLLVAIQSGYLPDQSLWVWVQPGSSQSLRGTTLRKTKLLQIMRYRLQQIHTHTHTQCHLSPAFFKLSYSSYPNAAIICWRSSWVKTSIPIFLSWLGINVCRFQAKQTQTKT